MTEMIELVDKNAQTVIISKFHMLKMVGENTNMVRRKNMRKMEMKLLEINNIVPDIESTLDSINSLHTVKES